jgi:hypothetical protein
LENVFEVLEGVEGCRLLGVVSRLTLGDVLRHYGMAIKHRCEVYRQPEV